MKRVIKTGKFGNTNVPYLGKCNSCGCEFEYTSEDIEHGSIFKQIPAYVRCPECHQAISHSDKQEGNISTMSLV